MNIRILPEAEYDLELGADFYESQREGLGRYFNDCLMADIESLRIYAGVHGRVYDLFRSLSKRFPFAIFYDGQETDAPQIMRINLIIVSCIKT